MGFTLGQMFLLGHRRALGWPVGVVACALWIIWAGDLGLWSIVVINALLGVLAARGWYQWTYRGRGAAAPVGRAKGPLLPMALGSLPAPGLHVDDPEAEPGRGK